MELYSGDGPDPWGPEALVAAAAESPDVRSLSLTSGGKHLHYFHKYVTAMREAVALGVAEEGSVVPDIPWALGKRNPRLVAIRKQNELVRASGESVGVSKQSDIESYSLAPLGKTPLGHFEHLCRLRKRGNYTGGNMLDSLDLVFTASQNENLIIPSDIEKRTGQMLKAANTRSTVACGGIRLGTIGEVEGACKQSNTTGRIARLATRDRVNETMTVLAQMKMAKKQKSVKEKQSIYDALETLLGHSPKKGHKFSAAELKAYIDSKLDGGYPAHGKKKYKTLAVIVPFLVKTRQYHTSGLSLKGAADRARREHEQLLQEEEKAMRHDQGEGKGKPREDDDIDSSEDDDDDSEATDDNDDDDDGDGDGSGGGGDGSGGGGDDDGGDSGARGDGDGAGSGGGGDGSGGGGDDGGGSGPRGDGGGSGGGGDGKEMNDFERLRRKNIAENEKKLAGFMKTVDLSMPSPPRKRQKPNIPAEPNREPIVLRSRKDGPPPVYASPPSPPPHESEDGSSFALDVNAIFGDNGTGPEVWYFVKMGHGRFRKVYFLDVSQSDGTCTINRCGYSLDTVDNVEIRKVFRGVQFPANLPWTVTLDTKDLQDVREQFAEFIRATTKAVAT